MSRNKNTDGKKWSANQIIFAVISFIILLSMILSLFSY